MSFRDILFSSVALLIIRSSLAYAQSPSEGGPYPGQRQTTSPPDQSMSGKQAGQLEQILVTAQKRSQNVQDTPLTVTSLSAATLRNSGVTNIIDLQNVQPSLNIASFGGVVTTFVRGLGNSVATLGNEASVPLYIDDVYYLTPSPAYIDLANIDRVETLEGPQGTLFGRNASSGVLSIYTRDPGPTRAFQGTLGYASYNTISTQLYGSTPISNNLATDLSVSYHNQLSGWGRDTTTGKPTYKEYSLSLRSKTVWKPTEGTTVKLIAYYVNIHTEQSGVLNAFYRDTFGGGVDATGTAVVPPQYQGGFYDTQNSRDEYITQRSEGGSLRIDQDLRFADFTSITAGRANDQIYYADGDGTQYPLTNDNLYGVDRQISQELQIKSKPALPYSWIVGAYYLNALEGYAPVTISGTAYSSVGLKTIQIYGAQRIKSRALFGQTTVPVPFIKNTNLTLGLRGTIDDLNAYGNTLSTLLGDQMLNTIQSGSKTFDKLTYKISLDHHFSQLIMGYFSYARGYKSGTFNTAPVASKPLNPEVVDTYEVGLKTELFEKRLRLNSAIFRNDVKDPQVQSALNGLEYLLNAGGARSQGVEIGGDALLGYGARLNFGATYLDAEYTQFQNAPLFLQSATGGNVITTIDATGKTLPRASKFKFNVGLSYATDLENLGSINANVSTTFQSRFYWNPGNNISQDPLALVNAALNYFPQFNSHLSFTFWGRNLTGVKYYSNEYDETGTSGFQATAAAPRTFGGELHFKY